MLLRNPLALLSLPALLSAFLVTGCKTHQAPPAPAPAWAAVAKGRVDIEGGLIKLAASRDGVITAVHVEEGADVVKGQVLATLEDRSARLAHELARRETEQLRAQLPALQVKVESSLREEKRIESLISSEGTSLQERDQARDLRRQAEADYAAHQAAIATAQARANQAAFEVDQRVVRAPLAGRIVRRMARPGDGVSTLNVTPLFLFAPDQPRIIRAELEEGSLPRVQPGQSAEILLESDEQRIAKGRVLRMGRVVGARQPSEDPSERADTRVAECVLSLDGGDFLIGQKVLVRIRSDR